MGLCVQVDISWKRGEEPGGWHGEFVNQYHKDIGLVGIAAAVAEEIRTRIAPETTVKYHLTDEAMVGYLIPELAHLLQDCLSPMAVTIREPAHA